MPDETTPQDAATPETWLGGRATPEVAAEAPKQPVLALLGRDVILAAPDLATEDVEVPEWGGTVRLRMLTGKERDAFEASCLRDRHDGTKEFDSRNMRAKLVALTLIDENGGRLFSEEDVNALGKKSAKALSRIFDHAASLNGIGPEDAKKLAGESDGQGGDSSSDSLWPSEEPSEN